MYRLRCPLDELIVGDQVACSTMTNSKDEGGVDSAEFARILTKQVGFGVPELCAGTVFVECTVRSAKLESPAGGGMGPNVEGGRRAPCDGRGGGSRRASSERNPAPKANLNHRIGGKAKVARVVA